jgi:DNA polymerase-1
MSRNVLQSPLPRHHYIVRGPDGIDDVFAKLRHGVLATDTETTGLDWSVDRVGALCFAAGDTAAFFCKNALGPAARWFADQVKRRRRLVFHNGKFDMHMIRETFGIHIAYPVHDTLIQSRLIDNRGVPVPKYPWFSYSHELDTLANHYVHDDASSSYHELIDAIRDRVGRHKSPMADWLMAPMRIYGKYGGRDPWYTLRLHDMFISMIQHWPQPPGYPSLMSLYHSERWLMLALRDTEERGVLLDQDYLHQWLAKAERRTAKIERRMNKRAGYELNWRSPPQIKSLFWDELGLEQVDGERTTKRVLLRMQHPLAATLLKHRKQAKMVSSGRALLRNIKADGALHCWYNQNVDTGRMSARDGVHQFARDSGVRKGVVPRKGLVLRSADYSQVEMRYAAHYSEEEILIRGFNTDPDFDTHAALARRMFGLGKRDPSPAQRDRGKTMNFAMLYGAGEDAVTEQLIDKISAEEARQSCIELGHSPKTSESPFRSLAQLLRNAVRSSYPKMWQFTKDEESIAKAFGFVIDAYGYHRWLDEEDSYKAMNSKLQGSAAHKAKEGMVAVYRELQLGTGQLAIIMQVHDDVVYESDGDPAVDRRVLELLEDRKQFRVPIIADMKGSDKNWQDKVSIKISSKRRRAA